MSGITAGELRKLLADVPDDTLVVLAKDAEGNGYSPLAGFSAGMYEAESPWSGDVYQTPEARAEWIAAGEDPDDWPIAPESAVRAVVLGPVN